MQRITTFLTFNDQAEEAVAFYTSIFPDSTIVSTNHQPSGDGASTTRVLSVKFELAGEEFIALNGGPSFTFAQGISLMVSCESQEEVDEYWERLTDGGEEGPCGWLTDKFGVSWQVVPRVLGEMLGDPDPQKAKKVMDAMLQMKKIDVNALQEAHEAP